MLASLIIFWHPPNVRMRELQISISIKFSLWPQFVDLSKLVVTNLCHFSAVPKHIRLLWMFEYIWIHQKLSLIDYIFFIVIFLLKNEPHAASLSFPGHFQQRRAYKTRTFTIIWKTWLSMYEAPLCGAVTGVDRTWLFRSVAQPALLIIHALQGSGHPHVLVKGLAPFLCYRQRERMSNAACFCWVLAYHPHQSLTIDW